MVVVVVVGGGDDVRSGPGGGGRDVDSKVLTSLEDKVRIEGLAIGYDLGRKGSGLSFAPACVDVVRWEYNNF